MKKLGLPLLALMLVACSPKSNSDDPFDARDPIKDINQATFEFNLFVDRYLVRPVSRVYHQIPVTGRDAFSNFLDNLHEPANVLNSTLQGDPDHAATSFWRFVLNTTFGLGGIRDFAGENGLKEYDANFDSTLKSYGVEEGSYVVLPLLGPSSVRGTVGYAVDWVSDPVGFYLSQPMAIAQTVSDAVVAREENDDIINQLYYKSLEPYTATRAAYLQHSAFRTFSAPANSNSIVLETVPPL